MALRHSVVRLIACSLALVSVWGVGCSRSPLSEANGKGDTTATRPAGGVAVVDLDLLAKRLGKDVEMNQAVEQATASVNEQLKSIHEKLQKEYFDELAKIAPSAAETEEGVVPAEKTAESAALKQRYDRQLAQITAQAQEKLAQHRASVVERFRGEVRPVAEKVAAARGQSIVVTKNDQVVFAFLPQADITDEVLEKLSPQVKPASYEE